MCLSGIARIALFVVNFALWLAGAVALAVGIWMKMDATIVNYLHVVNVHQSDPLIDHAALLFIIVGGVVLIIGFIGCLGAFRRSQLLLFVYATILIIVTLAELSAAVLTLLYKIKVEQHLTASMTAQVRDHYKTGATKHAWDYLQVKLSCCGANNYTDFENSAWSNITKNSTDGEPDRVPTTCCTLNGDSDYKNPVAMDHLECQSHARSSVSESEHLNTEGCSEALLGWFSSNTLFLLIIAFGVAFVQMLGVVVACWLRGALKRDKQPV